MSVDTVSNSPHPASPNPQSSSPPTQPDVAAVSVSLSPVYSPAAGAPRHIRLTSHAGGFGALPIRWGAATATERGPIVGTTTKRAHRNVIGTHSGSYSVYRALAVAAGALNPQHKADLTNTSPTDLIGPYPQWSDPGRIVSLDPWGAAVADVFSAELVAGYDIRPTIAVTQAHVILPEVIEALQTGRLKADGKFLTTGGAAMVTKAAIEPVWYLPEVARRFGCSDHDAGDPSWAHGSDNDRGPRADPVLRFLNQDATDTGASSDAPSHRRNRPQVFCPSRKRQRPARP